MSMSDIVERLYHVGDARLSDIKVHEYGAWEGPKGRIVDRRTEYDGDLRLETWYCYWQGDTTAPSWYGQDIIGRKHRVNGPAETMYDLHGNVISERWCLFGLLHRRDGPAEVEYPTQETLRYQRQVDTGYPENPEYYNYYVHGNLHREDGPATVQYCNGVLCSKYWFYEGELHRTDGGPAKVYCDAMGCLSSASWYVHASSRWSGQSALRVRRPRIGILVF